MRFNEVSAPLIYDIIPWYKYLQSYLTESHSVSSLIAVLLYPIYESASRDQDEELIPKSFETECIWVLMKIELSAQLIDDIISWYKYLQSYLTESHPVSSLIIVFLYPIYESTSRDRDKEDHAKIIWIRAHPSIC